MDYIPLRKDQYEKVESIFQWNCGGAGNCYSLRLKGNIDTFWCGSLAEVYKIIDSN